MSQLPLSDFRGNCLVSFDVVTRPTEANQAHPSPFILALLLVRRGSEVLFGYHVAREQWELPGGHVEAGESAIEAARRELEEETGMSTGVEPLAIRATVVLDAQGTKLRAAVFVVEFDDAQELIVSNELSSFRWWDWNGELLTDQNPLDAEIVRRSFVA